MSTRPSMLDPLRRLARVVGLLALVLTIATPAAGCAGSSPAPAAAAPTSAAAPPVTVLAASHPQRLLIPSISVDTGVIDLGLQPDGSMEVPADGSTAGWYTQSPTPGELGPAVLAAHVDWKGAKGVFYDLRRTKPGDPIQVQRADGSTAAFRVTRVEQYPKDKFPTREVYGDVDTAQLRLITCGGDFDSAAHSYLDNVVVYAELAAQQP
jgi:sortase (surface protein transpeptidase)